MELEVVMPSEMTVRQSHDICLGLQDAVEALDEVERAFVHVDYVRRSYPEHKTDRRALSRVREGGGASANDAVNDRHHHLGDDGSGRGESSGSSGTVKYHSEEDVEDPLLPLA